MRFDTIKNRTSWLINDKTWANYINFLKFKNIGLGKRCFIIGNGPSLNQTDLSKIKNEYTFGANRIYLLFDKLNFETSFYVSVNKLVLEQCEKDIRALSAPKFVNWRANKQFSSGKDFFYLFDDYDGSAGFSKNPALRIWEGSTVTYVSMQLAYYMGFSTVYLIGVDHSFATGGKPHEEVTSQGEDPNHFSAEYFGKGFRWNLPDLQTSEASYKIARHHFEVDGRAIYDATIGGCLEVFPKVEYSSLFSETGK